MLSGKASRGLVTIGVSCCLLLLATGLCFARSFKIYGSVSDTKNMALQGVRVAFKDKGFNATTDETGQYLIAFKSETLPEKYIISFSLKGCKTAYRAFTLKAGSSSVISLNIHLKELAAPVPKAPVQSSAVPQSSTVVAPVQEQKTATKSSAVTVTPPVIRTRKELRYVMGVPTYVDVPLTRAEVAAQDARLRAIQEAQNPQPKKVAVVTGPPVKFTISGNVVNEKGRSVGGADVFLGRKQEAYSKTDRRGKFSLEFLVPSCAVEMGRTVIVQHENFDTRNVPVRFNPKKDAGVALKNVRLKRYRGLVNR